MYNGDYSIGLDIGATSVGFSAIDEKYRPIRLKGKTVIGARLFKEGATAAERRGFRTTRRRLKRRKWRLSLLEEIFDPYMAKVDPTFFARLKESNLSPKDSKKHFSNSLLFPDETDSAFYDKYPTIYHLRYHLMNDDRQFDLREVFLAIHHIVKYRGNFLNNLPVSNFSTDKIHFEEDFKAINDSFDEIDPETGFQINIEKTDAIAQKLLDNNVATLDKQKEIAKILYVVSGDKALDKLNSSIAKQISKAMLGYKFDLAEVLKITTEDKNKWKIQLSDENVDDTLAELTGELNESQSTILNILLRLYSQITLNDIVPSGQTLSESMIEKYDAHKKHLEMLKKYAEFLDRKTYSDVMEAYAEYVGNSTKKSGTASQEDFYKVVKRSLNSTQLAEEIKALIDQNQFMPKQRTNQNGVIPYQLHLKELERIIENQSKYYPWLAEPNPNEKRRTRAKYKLSELVAFRIPYYVGPLITKEDQEKSSGKSFAWMIRKAPGKITPWNFDEKVDRTESANQFIKRMTTKDTYLIGEDVLPDHSLLYERFKVLNELNMVRANGSKLEVGEKQKAFEKLFKAKKTVKASQLANLLSTGMANRPIITGLSDPVKFNNSFGTYIDFKKIFGAKIDDPNLQNDFEQIVEWITVFEDKNILNVKLHGIEWLTEEQITDLIKKRYQGWGRLSKKLLCGLKNEKGESILDLMWNTQRTFMEIVNEPVFAEQIKNANQDQINDEDYESILADAYTSPQNKKAIRQVVKVVDDIVRAAGKAPKFISLEFAREDQRSHRTQSRLAKLKDIYETTAKELVANEKVRQELGDVKDLSDRFFLYFTQLGRDMYTGESINIDEISTKYDMDHILPQAFLKDDSLDNKVLVSRPVNNGKSNNVPLRMFGSKMKPLWKKLADHRLISKKKYNNLMTDPDSIDKYKANGFINRQLVETRQVIKLAANILASRYEKDDTQIIEVKAELNHQLREALKLYKNRDVNDYHHAVDGYLSAFVGQYLYHRYSGLQSYFIYGKYQRFFEKNTKQRFKFNRFNFLYDLTSNDEERIVDKSSGEIVGMKSDLIRQIKRVYGFKYMLISQETYTNSGAMFDQTIYPAKSNKKLIQTKQGRPTNIYGGYSGNKDAYMAIIRISGKKEDKLKVVGIPVRSLSKLERLKKGGNAAYLSELHRVIAERTAKVKTSRKTGEKTKVYIDFDIVVPKVMYRQLIVDGDLKYTLGSSTYQYNARQLVLSEKSMKILNTDFSKDSSSVDEQNEQLMFVYDDILDKVNRYLPLYDQRSYRKKLNDGESIFRELPPHSEYQSGKKIKIGKDEVLTNILQGLHADATRTNLKALKISSPFGMLQASNGLEIGKDSELIYQSPTGLFERRIRLSKLIK